MIIDPKKIINNGNLKPCEHTKIQQSGIDVTISKASLIIQAGYYSISLPYTLWPNSSYTFECNEYVIVPDNAVAMLFIRSTFNRKGAFITTGLYDNGFKGYIGGVIHTRTPMPILQNERIAQIVFMQSESMELYNGIYQDKEETTQEV